MRSTLYGSFFELLIELLVQSRPTTYQFSLLSRCQVLFCSILRIFTVPTGMTLAHYRTRLGTGLALAR